MHRSTRPTRSRLSPSSAADAARGLVFPGSAVATPVRPVVVERYADAK